VPFIPIHTFAGSGFSTRLCCPVSRDIIHCHSLGEAAWARLLCWTTGGHANLFSQVALPRQDTLRIASALGIRHPRYPDGTCCVMTTDFVQLMKINGKRQYRAVSVKAKPPLTKRKSELLEIEKVYWSEKNIPFFVCYKTDADRIVLGNIRWVEAFVGVSSMIWGSDKWRLYEPLLYMFILEGMPPAHAAKAAEAKLGMPKGSGLSLIRFYIANRIWEIDWAIELNPLKPMVILGRQAE
jgi:hypothetical protein